MRSEPRSLTRGNPAKALSDRRKAEELAAADAMDAARAVLKDCDPAEKRLRANAYLEAWLTLNASLFHPADVTRKVCGWAGRHHPDVARKSAPADEFSDVFKRRAAA